jgi:hypothetical protein
MTPLGNLYDEAVPVYADQNEGVLKTEDMEAIDINQVMSVFLKNLPNDDQRITVLTHNGRLVDLNYNPIDLSEVDRVVFFFW